VLVRKARSVKHRDLVAHWLYGLHTGRRSAQSPWTSSDGRRRKPCLVPQTRWTMSGRT
jgi:hypothetical protein